MWALRVLRPFLLGHRFHIYTDHRPLIWLMQQKDLNGQLTRFLLSIQEYSFDIVHRPGSEQIADFMSRFPCDTSVDTSGARMDAPSLQEPPLPGVIFQSDVAACYLLPPRDTSTAAACRAMHAFMVNTCKVDHFIMPDTLSSCTVKLGRGE